MKKKKKKFGQTFKANLKLLDENSFNLIILCEVRWLGDTTYIYVAKFGRNTVQLTSNVARGAPRLVRDSLELVACIPLA